MFRLIYLYRCTYTFDCYQKVYKFHSDVVTRSLWCVWPSVTSISRFPSKSWPFINKLILWSNFEDEKCTYLYNEKWLIYIYTISRNVTNNSSKPKGDDKKINLVRFVPLNVYKWFDKTILTSSQRIKWFQKEG